MIIPLLLLCLLPAQEARCVLHTPQPGYTLALVDVRRCSGQPVALWSAKPGGEESGVWRHEARVLVFTGQPVRTLVQGVNWGWWKIGDTRAVESLGWDGRERFARAWSGGEPMKYRGGVRP